MLRIAILSILVKLASYIFLYKKIKIKTSPFLLIVVLFFVHYLIAIFIYYQRGASTFGTISFNQLGSITYIKESCPFGPLTTKDAKIFLSSIFYFTQSSLSFFYRCCKVIRHHVIIAYIAYNYACLFYSCLRSQGKTISLINSGTLTNRKVTRVRPVE